jgi:hypothetical protein
MPTEEKGEKANRLFPLLSRHLMGGGGHTIGDNQPSRELLDDKCVKSANHL